MTWAVVIIVIIVGLFLSAVFSGAETGLYCVHRARVHVRAQEGERAAIQIESLLARQQDALSATLIGTNVMNYVTTTAVAYACAELLHIGEAHTELYTIVLLTPVVFVFGEVVPKTLFQRHAYVWLARCTGLLRVLTGSLRFVGLLWCLRHVTDLAARLATGRGNIAPPLPPRRRVANLIQEALTGGAAGEAQSYLIDRVMQLSEIPVHVAMVARNHVVTISSDAKRQDLKRIAGKTTHSRLPVFDALHKQRIIGIATVDDLLVDDAWQVVGDRTTPPLSVSPHTTVSAALTRMQSQNADMAVVMDRGGRMLGVVTLRGLLEEFLGDLAASVDSDPWWG